jgi:hypothetical protein
MIPVSFSSPVTDISVTEVQGKMDALLPQSMLQHWKQAALRDGNAKLDPLLVDAAKGDYRLQEGSPCRDAGKNASLPADVADLSWDGNTTEVLPKDSALNPRVHGDSVDVGAFEWHPPDD